MCCTKVSVYRNVFSLTLPLSHNLQMYQDLPSKLRYLSNNMLSHTHNGAVLLLTVVIISELLLSFENVIFIYFVTLNRRLWTFHQFNTAHINSKQHTSIQNSTHQFKTAHINSTQHTSIQHSTHQFNIAHINSTQHTSIQHSTHQFNTRLFALSKWQWKHMRHTYNFMSALVDKAISKVSFKRPAL